ncbi:hypothetical protein AOLI_G00316150 [Acnodon oligacanthus]
MAASLPPKLRFLTWNVNGLETALRINPQRPPDRQKDVRKEMEEADVVFLQETHIKRGQEDVMRYFPEWLQFYTVFDEAERGVAILIKNTISFEYIHHREDKDGFIVLHCKLEHQPYTLVSVYHHQTDEAILGRLSEYLQNNATGMMVIGGDFNAAFSPFTDKKEPTINQSHSVLLNRLKLFMRSLQLVDVWRRLHNFMRFYTFYRGENPSRIDFFFVPEECLWRVQSCEIEDVPANDHLPVSLEVNNAAVSSGSPPTDFPTKYTLTNGGDVRCARENITMAIKSLQVSDTPRLDEIPASVYKRFATDDFQALKNILRRNPSYGASQSYLLCQGCPLTPLLHTLLLRYVTERSLGGPNTGDIEIYVYKYFVNVVVPKNSPLGRPDEIDMNGLKVRRNIATSLEHVYVYSPLS